MERAAFPCAMQHERRNLSRSRTAAARAPHPFRTAFVPMSRERQLAAGANMKAVDLAREIDHPRYELVAFPHCTGEQIALMHRFAER